jgi:hypothetical protein
MTFEHLTAATTSWPDAAVAIAGIALVASVGVVVVWQALATWRTRIEVARERQYRELAEQTGRDLAEIRGRLGADRDVGEERNSER